MTWKPTSGIWMVKYMKKILTSLIVGLVLCSSYAMAADITLIAPGGIRAAVEQMIPAFEKKTGHKVKATFGSGLGTKAQVARGEPFDVPIVQPPYPEVIASGYVIGSTAVPLASVSVGIAVRKGVRKPDISTPASVNRLLLSASSI